MRASEIEWQGWLRDHRDILRAQLNLLDGGGPNVADGYADLQLFRGSPEVRETVAEWIRQIDNLIGPDDAYRT